MFRITTICVALSLTYGIDSSGLRATLHPASAGLTVKPVSSIALDQVLNGQNLTAVVVGAKALSNNTIQVVLQANITQPKMNSVSSPAPPKDGEVLNVRLVYGSGDPDSIAILKSPEFVEFFTRPLIINRTSLELVPFGRATEIDVNALSPGFLFWHPELRRGNITHVYRCPNGESECESNLIHSCAVRVAKNDPSIYLPFIRCMSNVSRGTSPEDSSFTCSNSTTFMEDLKDCALGAAGIELQHRLAHRANDTLSIPSFFIDGQFHPFNVSGIADLSTMLCDMMFAKGILDRDLCMGAKDKLKLTAPFESLLAPSGPSGHVNSKSTQ